MGQRDNPAYMSPPNSDIIGCCQAHSRDLMFHVAAQPHAFKKELHD